MFAKELVGWKSALSLPVQCLFRGEIPITWVGVQNKMYLKGVWSVYKNGSPKNESPYNSCSPYRICSVWFLVREMSKASFYSRCRYTADALSRTSLEHIKHLEAAGWNPREGDSPRNTVGYCTSKRWELEIRELTRASYSAVQGAFRLSPQFTLRSLWEHCKISAKLILPKINLLPEKEFPIFTTDCLICIFCEDTIKIMRRKGFPL